MEQSRGLKKYILGVSSNGWEYIGWVNIYAKDAKYEWDDNAYKHDDEKEDGNVVIADGVKIVFDEPFFEKMVQEEKA